MGHWDLWLKILLWESPQDFVSWLLPGARYIRRREGQFQTRNQHDGAFSTREIRADGMLEVEYMGQLLLIHVEFQSTKDEDIGERLLGYSYEARRLHKLPVYSYVIYLRHVFEPPQPLHEWYVVGIGVLMGFKYKSIELAEMPLEELEQQQFVGLAPLLLLTKDGATLEVLERAITQLEAGHKPEALGMLQWIAGMVFTSAEDLKRIQRRFANMNEYLWENSWTYREWAKEQQQQGIEQGRKQGREQGIEQGIEQGRVQGIEAGLRQSIEAVVQTRFPSLVDLAVERMEHIQDQAGLQKLLVAMSAASTERKAQRYLLALHEGK